MTDTLNRTWTEIHLDRLDNNVRCIRNILSPGARIMGIVKADAYGHGAVAVARRMRGLGVEYFGVSNMDEAIELRRAGITEPILAISYTPPTQAARLAQYNITQTVVSAEHAAALDAAAQQAGVKLSVHVKVDTGMSRVGLVCRTPDAVEDVAVTIAQICRLPALDAEGIFTHFACSDDKDDGGFTEHQFSIYMALLDKLGEQGITFAIRHCCNSAATLRFPHMHLDMVRPGIILYGPYLSDCMRELEGGLQPVMELKTTISMVKDLSAGVPVSYNRTYAADTPTRVATLPIGYADGYSRQLSNRGEMLVCGQRVPVIGRVCMDQTFIDVSDVPKATEGTEVTVFGSDGDAELPIGELSAALDTIVYETLCLITRRVPRRYFDKGEPVGEVNYLLD